METIVVCVNEMVIISRGKCLPSDSYYKNIPKGKNHIYCFFHFNMFRFVLCPVSQVQVASVTNVYII